MGILLDIAKRHEMIRTLALRDFQSRYIATLAGSLWTILHPIAIVVVFYFVFAVGFKSKGPGSTPFIIWFVTGLVAWFYFNDTLIIITDCITRNSYLVKKTIFPIEVLPLVQIFSALIPHVIFLAIVGILLVANDVPLMPFRLLVVYFIFCSTILLLGLGWLLSALQVFYRDIAQALSIIMNLWFWVTPIVWTPELMPEKYHWVFTSNPAHYLVEGYRGVLIYPQPVWPTTLETLYFWSIALPLFVLGITVFQRLKPEFADVL